MTEAPHRHTQNFYPLVHFPHSQKLEMGQAQARSFFQVAQVDAEAQAFGSGLSSAAFPGCPQEAGWGVEQRGHEPVSM